MRKLSFVAMTAALVLGATGTAHAASFKGSALVQSGNANCGKYELLGGPVTGSAKFVRTENKLKVTYKAKQLAPEETYELLFYDANPCGVITGAGTFVSSKKGTGKITAEVTVPEENSEFFVDAAALGSGLPFSNDSFVVTLPKPS
jgi:hypothetical protein